jgi:hypothetical protein
VLATWRRRQHRDGHPVGIDDPVFTNTTGAPIHPESISQLFTGQLERIDLPRIRFHDLRHTHATLLAGSNTPIKVVSERLDHAHPGFTMNTYQHVMPGMGATAARDFGAMCRRNVTSRPDIDGDVAVGWPVDVYRSTFTKPQLKHLPRRWPIDEPVEADRHSKTEKARIRNGSGPSNWWRG